MANVNKVSYDKKTGMFFMDCNKAMQELARDRILRKVKSDLEKAVSQLSKKRNADCKTFKVNVWFKLEECQ